MAAADPEPAEAREREIDTELREARAEITALREGIGRVRDEAERCRTAVCEALGRHMGLGWPTIVERVELAVAGASEREVLLTEARDALSEAGQTGAHGDDWPAVAPAIRALGAALAEALRTNGDAQHIIDMQREFIGELRQIIINAVGHREDEGVTEEACAFCSRDHIAELDVAVQSADKRYAQAFPVTADGSSKPGRIPGVEPTVTMTLPASAARALRAALPDGEL